MWLFSILSVLPAALLDLSLGNGLRPLVRIGYALSAAAVALHFAAAFGVRGNDRTTAFLLITVGFALLTAIALILMAAEPLRSDGLDHANRLIRRLEKVVVLLKRDDYTVLPAIVRALL